MEGVKHALTKGTRDNWPPQSRTLFAKYGDRRVLPNSFVACRYPISTNEMVKNVANLLGRKVPHDDLFHLQILFSVENAPELAIDKNEDMRLRTAKHKRARPEMECIPLQYNGPTMTLNEMVDNTMKLMGKEKFFSYSSFLNNCQDFVLNFMKANQLSGDMTWIKQDIADLLPKWAKKLADIGTNFKNIEKLVIEGKGNGKSGAGYYDGPSVKKNYLDLISDAEYWLEQEPWSATTNAWLNVLFKARQLVEEDKLEEAWELIKPFERLWGGIGASTSTSSTTGQGISGGAQGGYDEDDPDALLKIRNRIDEARRIINTLPRGRKKKKLWVMAQEIWNSIRYGDDEQINVGLTALTHLEEKVEKIRRQRDGTDSDSDGEAAPRGGGILDNYKKLNRGAGFFDELAKMRTPEGQDRSYCSRSFAMYRFTSKEGYDKAMNSCMAKRKKERESKTEGNGIPLVALAGIARQFRGHL